MFRFCRSVEIGNLAASRAFRWTRKRISRMRGMHAGFDPGFQHVLVEGAPRRVPRLLAPGAVTGRAP